MKTYAEHHEQEKWEREQNIRRAERAHDKVADRRRHNEEATIASGALAIRSALLVNGGAIVVILGFLGSVSGNEKIDLSRITGVTSTLMWFGLGVICAIFALMWTYLASYARVRITANYDKTYDPPYVHRNEKTLRFRRIWSAATLIAFLFGATSLLLFVLGVYDVKNAVAHLLATRG